MLKNFGIERRSDEFRRQILKNHNLSENAILLLYAGRISPEKKHSAARRDNADFGERHDAEFSPFGGGRGTDDRLVKKSKREVSEK